MPLIPSYQFDIDLAEWSLLLPWEVKFNKSWITLLLAIEGDPHKGFWTPFHILGEMRGKKAKKRHKNLEDSMFLFRSKFLIFISCSFCFLFRLSFHNLIYSFTISKRIFIFLFVSNFWILVIALEFGNGTICWYPPFNYFVLLAWVGTVLFDLLISMFGR